MIFNFDIKKFLYSLLPTFIRKQNLTDFLECLTSPLKRLYNLFLINRDSNLYRLDITSQVCKLEKMLNDRYDNIQRRIRITDGEFKDSKFLYMRAEAKPVYVHNASVRTMYLYQYDEYGFVDCDFIVSIPAGIVFNTTEVKSLLDSYKLVSITFTIQII